MEIEMGSVWYGMVVRCIWEWDMDRTLEFRDGLSVILGERKGNHSKGRSSALEKRRSRQTAWILTNCRPQKCWGSDRHAI